MKGHCNDNSAVSTTAVSDDFHGTIVNESMEQQLDNSDVNSTDEVGSVVIDGDHDGDYDATPIITRSIHINTTGNISNYNNGKSGDGTIKKRSEADSGQIFEDDDNNSNRKKIYTISAMTTLNLTSCGIIGDNNAHTVHNDNNNGDVRIPNEMTSFPIMAMDNVSITVTTTPTHGPISPSPPKLSPTKPSLLSDRCSSPDIQCVGNKYHTIKERNGGILGIDHCTDCRNASLQQ